MDTKELIIIGILVAVIIYFIKKNDDNNSRNNNTGNGGSTSSSGNGNNSNGSSNGNNQNNNSGSGFNQNNSSGNGSSSGNSNNESGQNPGIQTQNKDQNATTISAGDLDYVVNAIHKLFDWTFSDEEFDQYILFVKHYVHTRADMMAIMNADSYVYDRTYSWIINDPNRNRLTRLNQALKDNGVDLQYSRTI